MGLKYITELFIYGGKKGFTNLQNKIQDIPQFSHPILSNFIFFLKSCSTCREAHDIKDAVQLVVVVRVTGLDIFLATVEYGLRRQQLCKDAANRPDV